MDIYDGCWINTVFSLFTLQRRTLGSGATGFPVNHNLVHSACNMPITFVFFTLVHMFSYVQCCVNSSFLSLFLCTIWCVY